VRKLKRRLLLGPTADEKEPRRPGGVHFRQNPDRIADALLRDESTEDPEYHFGVIDGLLVGAIEGRVVAERDHVDLPGKTFAPRDCRSLLAAGIESGDTPVGLALVAEERRGKPLVDVLGRVHHHRKLRRCRCKPFSRRNAERLLMDVEHVGRDFLQYLTQTSWIPIRMTVDVAGPTHIELEEAEWNLGPSERWSVRRPGRRNDDCYVRPERDESALTCGVVEVTPRVVYAQNLDRDVLPAAKCARARSSGTSLSWPGTMSATISVVIPCYNHGHFLPYAIESVLAQTAAPIEIIVVDDGSIDETAAVSRRYGAAVTYLYQPNAGLSAARNTAIRRARGTFIQLLDADDILAPTALEHVASAMAADTQASVFHASWEEIDVDGQAYAAVPPPNLGADPFHAFFDPLLVGPPCRFTVRRTALLEAGLFDTRLSSCEDWDMWFRLALAGKTFVAVPDAFAAYRNHSGSMSKNHARMWHSGMTVLKQARNRHGCPVCDRAFAAGVRKWRNFCYLTTLREDLRNHVRKRELRLAAGAFLAATRDDPAIAALVAGSTVRRMRRRLSRAPG
jgi:glycosyltransferase involved in cell wall biosynthesis